MPYDVSKHLYAKQLNYGFNRQDIGVSSQGAIDSDLANGDVILDPYSKGIRVGVGGTLCFIPVANLDNEIVTIQNVQNGEYIMWEVRTVCKAGTTCTNIVPIQDKNYA